MHSVVCCPTNCRARRSSQLARKVHQVSLPSFFTINDRPVKVTDDPKGGWITLALDMGTGDWVPADSYLDRYFRRDGISIY